MIEAIVQGILEGVLRTIGWIVLKMVTFGRYRGYRDSDMAVEGAVGLLTLAAVCYLAYALWWTH